MASILNVDQINNAAGTSAVTIDASTGKPSFPNGANLPAGSVLQVVQFNYTSSTVIATGSYTALPILASITPSTASSKILVRCVVHVGTSGGNEGMKGRLYRNGLEVPIYGDAAGSRSRAWFHCGAHFSGNEIYAAVAEYLDSPSSTASQTYQIYGRGHSSPYPVKINASEIDADHSTQSRTVSSITLMEIAQ